MNNKRIAKNTLMLYIRQILILLVNLYTVRVVLNTLGVEDYGIYHVVAGIVSLFLFLSGTLSSATQRFFSFALGQEDFIKLKKTFSINLIVYGAVAIFALVLLETIGLWFVKEQLRIPFERIEAANIVYHFAVFSFIVTIITAPFMAIIIAHEDMHIYAYVSIVEAIMKLSIVFLLIYLPWDKLELYGILFFIVTVINSVIYITICIRKYAECQFSKFYWDKKMLHELIGFTGWTLFGQITTIFRNQAITILLNQMFSPIVVTAKSIASNVAGQVNLFSSNFNIGLYPPIVKSYAANDKNSMFIILFKGSKATFFLMWVFALPLFLEMDTILHLWLINPPLDVVLFTRLALIEVLINSISLPLTTAARAPGKMKVYELTLGSIQILIFVISWMVLIMGFAAYSVFIVAIIANIIMLIVRLFIVKILIDLPLRLFFVHVIFPAIKVLLLSSLFSASLHLSLPESLFFRSLSMLFSILTSCICMYFVGCGKDERAKIRNLIINKIQKRI